MLNKKKIAETFFDPGSTGHRFDSCWENSDFFSSGLCHWLNNIFLRYNYCFKSFSWNDFSHKTGIWESQGQKTLLQLPCLQIQNPDTLFLWNDYWLKEFKLFVKDKARWLCLCAIVHISCSLSSYLINPYKNGHLTVKNVLPGFVICTVKLSTADHNCYSISLNIDINAHFLFFLLRKTLLNITKMQKSNKINHDISH